MYNDNPTGYDKHLVIFDGEADLDQDSIVRECGPKNSFFRPRIASVKWASKKSIASNSRHESKYHNAQDTGHTPVRCSYPGCIHETEFKSASGLFNHHGTATQQSRRYYSYCVLHTVTLHRRGMNIWEI